jgi:hypothetical protein
MSNDIPKTPASGHEKARLWLALGLGVVLAVLAWHHQGQALVPYLGQILGLSLSKSPGSYHWRCLPCSFMYLYYTIKLDEMSIGETLILGVQKPDF